MLNKAIIIGRLTRDPELRYTPNGIAVATFTVAVDRPFENQQGKREADFIKTVAWRKLGEICANNLGKGRLVAVEGRLQIRTYQAEDGTNRQVAEVIAENVRFLDWPKDQQSNNNGQAVRNQSQSHPQASSMDEPFGSGFDFPDDLPF